MAIKTLTEVLNSISVDDIDKSTMSDSEFDNRVNSLLGEGYSYIALQSNGSDTCGNLLSFKRIQNFSVDTLLVKSDEVDNNNYSRVDGEVVKNHPNYKDKGTFFGLKYDDTDKGFYTNDINFFGRGLSKDVWFDRMGINAKPIPKHVYVKAKPHKENKFHIPGSFYVASGSHPMVYVGNNAIISAYPVYVFGKSSDWHIEGGTAGGALNQADNGIHKRSTCRGCTHLYYDPTDDDQESRYFNRSGWNTEFYKSNNEIDVDGPIYTPNAQSIDIQDFMETSESFSSPAFNPSNYTLNYLTGYASDNDFQSGYSHSGYDFLNSSNYNF
jgi:hypothetical protein